MEVEKRVLTSLMKTISGLDSLRMNLRARIALGFASSWQFQVRIFIELLFGPLWVIESEGRVLG